MFLLRQLNLSGFIQNNLIVERSVKQTSVKGPNLPNQKEEGATATRASKKGVQKSCLPRAPVALELEVVVAPQGHTFLRLP